MTEQNPPEEPATPEVEEDAPDQPAEPEPEEEDDSVA